MLLIVDANVLIDYLKADGTDGRTAEEHHIIAQVPSRSATMRTHSIAGDSAVIVPAAP